MPKPPSEVCDEPPSPETPPSSESNGADSSPVSRVSPDYEGYTGLTVEVACFISKYIILSPLQILVVSAWLLASYLQDAWDRFGHLGITSPEKRCAKSRFIEVLACVALRPEIVISISPPAMYRKIEAEKPTIFLDELQSLSRRGSETAEVIRELLNASISRNALAERCFGRDHEVRKFSLFCPKVLAKIDDFDSVLADRCIPIRLERKRPDEVVERYRSKRAEREGEVIRAKITVWADENLARAKELFDDDETECFDIENDRLAELLIPLQIALTLDNPALIPFLEDFATSLDHRDQEEDESSVGIQLLTGCREIFDGSKSAQLSKGFLPTQLLISSLVLRKDEQWATFDRGVNEITGLALSKLLRKYGIKPTRGQFRLKETAKAKQEKGYYRQDFVGAWEKYLRPSQKDRTNPPNPTNGLGGVR